MCKGTPGSPPASMRPAACLMVMPWASIAIYGDFTSHISFKFLNTCMCTYSYLYIPSPNLLKNRGPLKQFPLHWSAHHPRLRRLRVQHMMLFYTLWKVHTPSCKFSECWSRLKARTVLSHCLCTGLGQHCPLFSLPGPRFLDSKGDVSAC